MRGFKIFKTNIFRKEKFAIDHFIFEKNNINVNKSLTVLMNNSKNNEEISVSRQNMSMLIFKTTNEIENFDHAHWIGFLKIL